jgi:hypothetical protein
MNRKILIWSGVGVAILGIAYYFSKRVSNPLGGYTTSSGMTIGAGTGVDFSGTE